MMRKDAKLQHIMSFFKENIDDLIHQVHSLGVDSTLWRRTPRTTINCYFEACCS